MKKIFVCALMVLAFSLTGCTRDDQPNNDVNQNIQQDQTQANNNNDVQTETSNNNVQQTISEIPLVDWVEAITINGVKWTEFTTDNVTESFGNLIENKNTQSTDTITFTDVDGWEYTGTIVYEENREDEIVLRFVPDNEIDDVRILFEFEKNNAGVYELDGIRIARGETSSMEDILVGWGIDKLDTRAFEMATNVGSNEREEYSFTTSTDYGMAEISVENDVNDEGYKEIQVEIDFVDESVPYSIDLLEVYEGNDAENAKYFEIHVEK